MKNRSFEDEQVKKRLDAGLGKPNQIEEEKIRQDLINQVLDEMEELMKILMESRMIRMTMKAQIKAFKGWDKDLMVGYAYNILKNDSSDINSTQQLIKGLIRMTLNPLSRSFLKKKKDDRYNEFESLENFFQEKTDYYNFSELEKKSLLKKMWIFMIASYG